METPQRVLVHTNSRKAAMEVIFAPKVLRGTDQTMFVSGSRKVDVWLPEKGNSNFHGARPVHLITTMIRWIRTGKLSIKKSLSLEKNFCPATQLPAPRP